MAEWYIEMVGSEEIPNGYELLFFGDFFVAGTSFAPRVKDWLISEEKSLELERERNNRHDKNAIKIIGLSKGSLGRPNRRHIGYVDKFTARDLKDVDIKNIIPLIVDIYFSKHFGAIREIRFKYKLVKKLVKKFNGYELLFSSTFVVAGTSFSSFAKDWSISDDKSLELERERDNRHDKNAVKIFGLSKNCFGTPLRTHLGYVDKFTARDLKDVDIKNIIPLIVDILAYENSKKMCIKYRLEKKSA